MAKKLSAAIRKEQKLLSCMSDVLAAKNISHSASFTANLVVILFGLGLIMELLVNNYACANRECKRDHRRPPSFILLPVSMRQLVLPRSSEAGLEVFRGS